MNQNKKKYNNLLGIQMDYIPVKFGLSWRIGFREVKVKSPFQRPGVIFFCGKVVAV